MESLAYGPPKDGEGHSKRLESLLDKLVAIHIDLEPICSKHKVPPDMTATVSTIADACEVLCSAIADVRNIIHQAHSLAGLTLERRSPERA